MSKIYIKAIIEPDGEGYHAYCPELKGLHTCGDTYDEAIEHLHDAITAYLQSIIKNDIEVTYW